MEARYASFGQKPKSSTRNASALPSRTGRPGRSESIKAEAAAHAGRLSELAAREDAALFKFFGV